MGSKEKKYVGGAADLQHSTLRLRPTRQFLSLRIDDGDGDGDALKGLPSRAI